jgi:hypothetical protein
MADMIVDGSGFEAISDAEALALLATAPVGRLIFSDRALPFVVPVSFVVDGLDIIMRTGRRSRLATHAPGNVVAFEVDDIAIETRSGWSVVVTGRVELVHDRVELGRFRALDIEAWLPSETDCYLRLRAELIAGRRIPALAGAAVGVLGSSRRRAARARLVRRRLLGPSAR